MSNKLISILIIIILIIAGFFLFRNKGEAPTDVDNSAAVVEGMEGATDAVADVVDGETTLSEDGEETATE